ncbi:MAG: hypothetical protein DRP20_04505 [Thermotogae bacterium]|nr:MAG: hypothetical protein DRP20_04505 [Thermotogota bacterium]
MAENALDMLGVSQEVLGEIKPEEVYESKVLDSALYDAEVQRVYVRKTDSGAKMLEIDFTLPPGEQGGEPTPYHYATCVMSGDNKGNKTTYTSKQGKEIPLPGVASMTKFLGAIDQMNAGAVQGDIDHRGDKIKALCFTGLQGLKLKIGMIQEENFYQGNVTIKNDVKYWLNENGENTVGDNLIDKVIESIEKYPVKKLKASATTTTAPTTTGGSEAPSQSGW